MRELEFDGIIIGAGPNGLTTAGYLAKAGLKVAVLERRYEIGGGLATENLLLPGMLVDSHAIYHMMCEYAPAVATDRGCNSRCSGLSGMSSPFCVTDPC